MKIAVVFGGRSAEHEVSVVSASCIWQAMGESDHELMAIGIDHEGLWWHLAQPKRQFKAGVVARQEGDLAISLVPMRGLLCEDVLLQCDVVFPVLHGTFGEDGTIQGLFEMLSIPYVGAGVLGSSVAMDKGIARAIFAASGIQQPAYRVYTHHSWTESAKKEGQQFGRDVGYPLFVKPCNLGSSVGISKVDSEAELTAAMALAFNYDNRVIIEKGITDCREIECAVIGNAEVSTSVAGEITPGDEFYSYDDKYHDGVARTQIPARLDDHISEQVRNLAEKAYRAADIAGLARIDFLLQGDDIYINEINTLPGFTPISMYPKLWQESGVDYVQLIEQLCALALARFHQRQLLTTERS